MDIVVIVRHAHRDTLDKDLDNGLSSKGQHQAEELVEQYRVGELPPGDIFLSSPKKRCQETLQPLAEEAEQTLKIEKLLDEQLSEESQRDLEKRVEKFLKAGLKPDKTTYICSHGDWIPIAIKLLTGEAGDLQKGHAAVFTKKGKNWID